ncbi:hypothetical protein AXF42_Ash009862 [Apostasia shenzhenica]|uniref:Uncharacterized protein n=1 Tax=Apostasia shenzhenica TaxID=1088818 RepID=A0A2I0AC47_9ASPA|nr:hypothetical protein AXF42_Ash009862 [Apostasia shenzhenica]
MGSPKLSLGLMLILCGIILQCEVEEIKGALACPLYCLDVKYMTCTSSGGERLPGRCNCCLAPKGCTLHLTDGTTRFCVRYFP